MRQARNEQWGGFAGSSYPSRPAGACGEKGVDHMEEALWGFPERHVAGVGNEGKTSPWKQTVELDCDCYRECVPFTM